MPRRPGSSPISAITRNKLGPNTKKMGWVKRLWIYLSRMIVLIIMIFITVIFLLRIFRHKFYFQPIQDHRPSQYLIAEENETWINSRIHTYSTRPFSKIESSDILIVYMHGRFGNLFGEFGKTTGRAKYDEVLRDGLMVGKWVSEQYPDNVVIYYGESIGTSVATHTTLSFTPDALVLKAPFASMQTVVQDLHTHLPRWLIRYVISDEFDTMSWIKKYKGPKTLFYNENDQVIPNKNTFRLPEDISRHPLPGGHSDCRIEGTWTNVMVDMIKEAKAFYKIKKDLNST